MSDIAACSLRSVFTVLLYGSNGARSRTTISSHFMCFICFELYFSHFLGYNPCTMDTPETHAKPRKNSYSLLLVALIVIGLGFFWIWNRLPSAVDSGTEQPEILTWVDRGISEEDYAIFQTQLDALLAEKAEVDAKGETDINLLLRLGNAYYTVGELGTAVEYYDAILKDYENDVAALENKGQALLEMRDYAGAEVTWKKAISLGAQETTYFSLAKLMREQFPDRTDEIRPLIEGGIATYGQTQGFMVELGNWYRAEGDLDTAISHYEVAYELSGKDIAIKAVLDQLRNERAQQIEENERAQTL